MTISLLHIVVPTILILVVLILYINTSKKQVLKEVGELKAQLEKLDNVPGTTSDKIVAENVLRENEPYVQEPEKSDNEKKEGKDAPAEEISEAGASGYNTGKSGKIYTKEELELLIKE